MKLKLLLAATAMLTFASPAFATSLNVAMNRSEVVRLEGSASTVVLGNPMVADVTVVAGNTLVVQGRLPGNTDVLVLDAAGAEIASFSVSVNDNWSGGLTLIRGTGQSSYVCARECNRVLRPGDEQTDAEILANQQRAVQDITQRGMMLGANDAGGSE